MCAYCMVGDEFFRHNPPWPNQPGYPWHPHIPAPANPAAPAPPWDLARLKEFEDVLKRVKALEDQLGCPCEPNKADYLGLLKERIEKLEADAAKQATPDYEG
jgi:hypothetical protein